ncbi:MAG: DUF3592 domain-containing protein [Opitutales bacterium]|nr:DUF3592 domain-containing protein [Opitutales bacterium]
MKFRLHLPGQASSVAPGKAGFRGMSRKSTRTLGIVIGLVFLSAGMGIGYFLGVRPLLQAMESGSWPQVPCRIVSSEVESRRTSDGTTYRVAIRFQYKYEGRQYTGGSHGFDTAWSSGRASKQRIVGEFPVGLETTCYVDPDNPETAVLSRAVPTFAWIMLPFSGAFFLAGLAVMLGSLGVLPEKWALTFGSSHRRVTQEDHGTAELKPGAGPWGKLSGVTFAAVLWNGVVGIFLFTGVVDPDEGGMSWLMLAFMTPFVLVGAGLLGAVVYCALALFNPRLWLTLSEAHPRLGQTVQLRWRTEGALHRVQHLSVLLEGRESATYRRGTRSVTDRALFHREVIFETNQPLSHREGGTVLTVPAESMHTFEGGNNRIEWTLVVRGKIPLWPNVNDSYPVTVRPQAPGNFAP